ncbi:MAG: hypothetical protein R2737_15985 [Candidatus Nanopelagicales bacterium]
MTDDTQRGPEDEIEDLDVRAEEADAVAGGARLNTGDEDLEDLEVQR